MQTGMIGGELATLVAGDAALRSGLTTSDEIRAAVEAYAHAPGIRTVAAMLPRLHEDSGSPLESLLRYALHLLGYDVVPQVRVDAEGRLFDVDLKLRGRRLVFEVDGAVKYRTDPKRKRSPEQVVMAEKGRHSSIERMNLIVLRFTREDIVDVHGRLRLQDIDRRVKNALSEA